MQIISKSKICLQMQAISTTADSSGLHIIIKSKVQCTVSSLQHIRGYVNQLLLKREKKLVCVHHQGYYNVQEMNLKYFLSKFFYYQKIIKTSLRQHFSLLF